MSFIKKFKHTFHISIWEAIIALLTIGTFFVLKYTVHEVSMFIIVLGFIVGTWLAFRPSEWAVSGLNSGAKYVGLSDYVAGIISSLASNLPEGVIAVLLILEGQELMATVTVLSAAGFNSLILGIAILIATLKSGTGHIRVPEDLEKKEAPIIRWAIVALLMTVIFGFLEYFQAGFKETSDNTFVLNLDKAKLTIPVAIMLALGYIVYLIYLVLEREDEEVPQPKPSDPGHIKKIIKGEMDEHDDKLPIPLTIGLLLMGFVGIFFGGETLTWCVEHLIESGGGAETEVIYVALLLGAAGAVPEHSIAIISAIKGEVEVGIGNAMGGILQSALLIFGILGMIVSITLYPFVILQLGAIAVTLWFVKRCIQDGRFDVFEGVMIILLQILVFILYFEDVLLFGSLV